MSQSRVIGLDTRRPQSTKAIVDQTAEEVLDAIDSWLAAESGREFKVRTNVLGHVATLFSGGNPVAVGRGRGAVNALASALENYEDPVDPDADENEWNRRNNGGCP